MIDDYRADYAGAGSMKKRCPHNDGYKPEKLPQGISANRHRTSALAYADAAKKLFDSEENNLRQPAYFAISHAVELFLKAYLLAKGIEANVLATKMRHCLECLWVEAKENGLIVPGYDMPVLMHHLNEYSIIFRYPDIQILEALSSKDLMELVAVLDRATKSAIFKAYLKELGPNKPYGITFFSHGGREGSEP
ncbi:HEPN domain-containing protein [Oceanibaculum sp.]|uniref:HEPN domain-containing protein n=1 Tax=Oceanibaculum sp. TaxID=1903597 RepID=UPI00258F24F3|nr:HEPN domain-containing protein [Oceanibaculum sp.]MCH2393752.1 HEPN domain-containing protein [Oceanibaculum sp.]